VVEEAIVSAVNELRASLEVAAVGVGAAGFVAPSGTVRFAPHLSWRDEPLQDVLVNRLGLPVAVDNDANTAARAEMTFGAGRGHRHAICVTLGTGIGGALVIDGAVVRGAQGFAGEFGHMQVVPNGRLCECGQHGCWEQYCSGKALAGAVREVAPSVTSMTGPTVTAAAASGQEWALKAFHEIGTWLGVGLAGLASAFDPEVVIVGGGLSDAADLLLEPARKAFAARLPGKGYRNEPPILRAALGPDAGFIGAAELARISIG
jgi:glucokinase